MCSFMVCKQLVFQSNLHLLNLFEQNHEEVIENKLLTNFFQEGNKELFPYSGMLVMSNEEGWESKRSLDPCIVTPIHVNFSIHFFNMAPIALGCLQFTVSYLCLLDRMKAGLDMTIKTLLVNVQNREKFSPRISAGEILFDC